MNMFSPQSAHSGRRTLLAGLVALTSLCALSSPLAHAQAYPSKPIQLVVPYGPGGNTDILARVAAQKLGEVIGQPVIIDNKPGAYTLVGIRVAHAAAPDGYTVLLGASSTHVSGNFLVKNMPYDSFADFTPLGAAVNTMGALVVHPSVPANSMKELLEYARSHPGKLAYGSNGVGSSYHLITELIKLSAGVDMLHVPYQGSGQVLNALMGGHLQVGFNGVGEARKHLATGNLRVLAIATAQRFSAMPNIPTLAEVIPGYETLDVWLGFYGPAKMPEAIVNRLNAEIIASLNSPDVIEKLEAVGIQSLAGPPAELTQRMRREMQIYARIFKAAKIEAQ